MPTLRKPFTHPPNTSPPDNGITAASALRN